MQRDDVIVFLGPTLPVAEARQFLDADYRMPASRGDLYRVSKSDPHTIVIIDGAFESDAAVLHNEILWTISKGISVWGAASMGALRAAELAPFGMIGVGKIFEAYRDGTLERDDAVAVVHGPAELGYPLLSTPLVDVWATLERAFDKQLLSVEERTMLRDIAAEIFYKQLGIQTVIETAVQKRFAKDKAERLRHYVTTHGVFSQKRVDAVQVLNLVSRGSPCPPVNKSDFVFERTSPWEKLVLEDEQHDAQAVLESTTFDDEMELAAIGLVLAEREARRRGYEMGHAEFQAAARSFRHQNKLSKFADVRRWMEAAGFEHHDYVKLIEEKFHIQHSHALTHERWRNVLSRIDRMRRGTIARMQLTFENLSDSENET